MDILPHTLNHLWITYDTQCYVNNCKYNVNSCWCVINQVLLLEFSGILFPNIFDLQLVESENAEPQIRQANCTSTVSTFRMLVLWFLNILFIV